MTPLTEGELLAIGALIHATHPRLSAKCFALGNELASKRASNEEDS